MHIIVHLSDGFGNQLFSYAFGYALSQDLKVELCIDTSMHDYGIAPRLELLNFDIQYSKRISYAYYHDIINRAVFNKIRQRNAIGWTTHTYCENKPTVYDAQTKNITENTFFRGYWQTEKYFKKYRAELLEMFQPKSERSVDVRKMIEMVSQKNSVAIHVRRGDYISIGCHLQMDFYDKAICFIKEKLGSNLSFYVFSDDLSFCKQYFKKFNDTIKIEYLKYLSDNTTLDDLLIMSHCRHIIMANSTYSWWGAWLNQNENKIVVCPELGMWTGDFYPKEWIKIKI